VIDSVTVLFFVIRAGIVIAAGSLGEIRAPAKGVLIRCVEGSNLGLISVLAFSG